MHRFGRTPARAALGAALSLAVLSCGASSPGEDADAAQRADAADTKDSAVVDRASEPDVDAGAAVGFFFCPDPSSYFLEVKAADGQNWRLGRPCDSTASRFGTAQAWLTRSYFGGRFSASFCAADERGATLSIDYVPLDNFNGGSVSASGFWRDSMLPDATAVHLGGTVDITRVGSIGDTIEGSYVFTSSSVALSGSFRICHLFDYLMGPPP